MRGRRGEIRALLFRTVSGLAAVALSVAAPAGVGSKTTPAEGGGQRIGLREFSDAELVLDGVVVALPEVVVPGFRVPRSTALRIRLDPDTTLGFDRDRREVGIRVALDLFRLGRSGR